MKEIDDNDIMSAKQIQISNRGRAKLGETSILYLVSLTSRRGEQADGRATHFQRQIKKRWLKTVNRSLKQDKIL